MAGTLSRKLAASAAMAIFALTACASQGSTDGDAPAGGDQVTLGALYLDAQGFYGGIKKGIEDGASEGGQNVQLLGQNSGGDATREAQFMSTLISGGAQAIIMSPVSATASVPVIQQAVDADIPVVCYNTCVAEDQAEGLIYGLVTTDQTALGYDVGVVAGNYFRDLGVTAPRFGILNCDVYEACVQRKEGFKQAVEEILPDVEWVADQAGFEPDVSTTTATTMLNGTELDAFFATTDNGTIGAVQGVLNTNNAGNTVVFGNDISLQLAGYFQSNPDVLIATNGQDPQAMGRAAVELALRAIDGEPAEEFLTIIPTQLFEVDDEAAIAEWMEAHADGIP